MPATKLARLAAVAALAVASGAAFADTQNLSVSATVTAACKLIAVPAMTFSLDPTNPGPATATSSVQYKCTNGTPAGAFSVGTVTDGSAGYTGTLNSGSATMAYGIKWPTVTAFTGNGFGAGSSGNTVLLTGSIAGTAYQNAVPGTYSGVVAVTIAP